MKGAGIEQKVTVTSVLFVTGTHEPILIRYKRIQFSLSGLFVVFYMMNEQPEKKKPIFIVLLIPLCHSKPVG